MPPPLQALIELGFDESKFTPSQLTVVKGLREVYAESVKINELKISPGAENSWTQLTANQEKYQQALLKTEQVRAKADAANATAKLKQIQLDNAVIQQINLEQQATDRAAASIEKKNAAAAKASAPQPQTREEYVNSIPFTSNLAQLEEEQNAVKTAGIAVNEFEQAEVAAILANQEWAESIEVAAAANGTLDNSLLGLNEAVVENGTVSAEDAKIQAELANEYKQLTLAAKDAEIKVQQLYFTVGKGHPATQEAIADSKALTNILKDVDAQNGKAGRSVGSYSEAIEKSLTKVTSLSNISGRVITQLGRGVTSLLTGGLSFVVGAKALELAGQGIAKVFEYAFPPAIKLATAISAVDATLSKSNPTVQKAIENVDKLKGDIDLAKTGFENKDKVLKEYNDTLGKSIGQVDTLDQAEQMIAKNADNFIKATIYKAAALEILNEAADAAVKHEKDLLDDEAIVAPGSAAGKTVFGHQGATKTGAQLAAEDIKKKNDEAKKEQDNFIKVYEELTKKANSFGFNLDDSDKKGASDNEKLKKRFDLQDELRKIELQKSIDFNQSVEKDESKSLDIRLDALKSSYASRKELLTIAKNEQLQLNKEDQQSLNEKIGKDKPGTGKQNDLIELQNDKDKAIVIETKYRADVVKLAREGTEAAQKFQEAAESRMRTASESIVKDRLDTNIKAQEEIFKDETVGFDDKLQALAQFNIDQSEIITNEANKQKQKVGLTAQEIAAIDADAGAKRIALAKQIAKEMSNAYISSANYDESQAKAGVQGGEAAQELSLYNSLRNKADFSKKSLEIQDAEAQKEIDIDEAKQRDLLSSQFTSNDAKVKAQTDLDTDLTAQDKLTLKTQQDQEAEALAQKKQNLDLAKELSIDAIDIVQSVEDAAFNKRQQQLETELNAVKDAEQQKIDAIRTSSLSAQQARAQTAIVEAQANAQARELQREERANAVAKAKFDRDAGIAKVIINTAIAVTEAAPVIPLEIAAAAAGAVQLAAILATPIPAYAKGTQNHPGGLALFGEAGNEMVEEPGKNPFIAYKPTLASLAAGSKVTPMKNGDTMNDYLLHKAYSNINVTPEQVVDEKFLAASIVDGVGKHLANLTNAVKKQKAPIVNFISNSDHADWVNKSVRN